MRTILFLGYLLAFGSLLASHSHMVGKPYRYFIFFHEAPTLWIWVFFLGLFLLIASVFFSKGGGDSTNANKVMQAGIDKAASFPEVEMPAWVGDNPEDIRAWTLELDRRRLADRITEDTVELAKVEAELNEIQFE